MNGTATDPLLAIAQQKNGPALLRARRRAGLETARQQRRRIKAAGAHRRKILRETETVW